MYVSRVQISRYRSPGHASCESCDALNPEATRERCRQHAVQTGHTVHYLIEDTTTYRPDEIEAGRG